MSAPEQDWLEMDSPTHAASHATEEDVCFGTFFIGASEFAISTENFREVVPFPATIASVPLASQSVMGLFTLREEVLPLVDLTHALSLESDVPLKDRQVAVLESEWGEVGVVLDRTGTVLRTHQRQLRECKTDSGIVNGIVKCSDVRVVQTLSAAALGDVSGLPRQARRSQYAQAVEAKPYFKSVVVRVGETELGLRIEDVLEIQAALDVQGSPAYFRHCAGVVQLRGLTYPVLDLRDVFQLQKRAEKPKFVFVNQGGCAIALVVDDLVETVELPEDQILQIPVLSTDELSGIFRSVIAISSIRHPLIVDLEHLYASFEIHEVACLNGMVDSEELRSDLSHEEEEERGFLGFEVAGSYMTVPVESVLELNELDQGTFDSPTESDGFAGFLSLRGQVAPLLDLQVRLGLGDGCDENNSIAIVLSVNDQLLGLVVDSIRDIRRVNGSNVSDCSNALGARDENTGTTTRFVDSILQITDHRGLSETIVVLDVELLAGTKGREASASSPEPIKAAEPGWSMEDGEPASLESLKALDPTDPFTNEVSLDFHDSGDSSWSLEDSER